MGLAETTITIPVRSEVVYGYLRRRYEKESYKKACVDTKGYVPRVECCQDDDGRVLSFWVAGRDVLTGVAVSGWEWGYELTEIDEAKTEVRIWYKWGWTQAVLGLGSTRHQAGSEITETVLALEALGTSSNGGP